MGMFMAVSTCFISGICWASSSGAANADPEIDGLVQARTEAKKAKNFAEADRIRDELKAQGVEVTDMPGGAKWKRV